MAYIPGSRGSLEQRFWSKVDKTSSPTGCWLWTGYRNPKGYGRFGPTKKIDAYSHRVSYEMHKGPIPAGLLVCHRCDNPPCVNPKHLFTGTMQDNVDDMMSKGRHIFQKFPEKHPRGENAGPSKLTAEKVQAIHQLLDQGDSQQKIAVKFGVSQGLISHIKLGHSWKHLVNQ